MNKLLDIFYIIKFGYNIGNKHKYYLDPTKTKPQDITFNQKVETPV
jgi:hypothetical protein